MLIEIESYIFENFKKNEKKLYKLLFPLKELPIFTDEEMIKIMNEGQEHILSSIF